MNRMELIKKNLTKKLQEAYKNPFSNDVKIIKSDNYRDYGHIITSTVSTKEELLALPEKLAKEFKHFIVSLAVVDLEDKWKGRKSITFYNSPLPLITSITQEGNEYKVTAHHSYFFT